MTATPYACNRLLINRLHSPLAAPPAQTSRLRGLHHFPRQPAGRLGTAVGEGPQPPSESSDKSVVEATGGTESGTVAADPVLALVVDRWHLLSPHSKATILGIVRRAGR